MTADDAVAYKGARIVLVPAGLAALGTLAYPLVWGPFAIALTLLGVAAMSTVAVCALAVSLLVVRPRVSLGNSAGQARRLAVLTFSATGTIVTAGWIALIVLGSRTPDGTPQFALFPPVALGLGITLGVYLAVLITGVRWFVFNTSRAS